MANPYQAVFRDDNSDTRLAGSIDFTDTANQPGFAVVSCVMTFASVDIHAAGTQVPKIASIVNNVWDFAPLAAIPPGLGLSFLFDGSSSSVATTTPGTWIFSTSVSVADADATLVCKVVNGFSGDGTQFGPPADSPGPTGVVVTTECFTLPSGASADVVVLRTLVNATANPFNALNLCSVVRIA